MQPDNVSVTGVSLPLSLLVWEVLESRDIARLSQFCFLEPARSLATERREYSNRASGTEGPRSLLQTQPPPSHSSCGRKPSQILNLFQIYPYARDRL